KGGMKMIEYDNSFFSDVLAIQGVRDLYKRIDAATNGLASTLEKSLADVAEASKPKPATAIEDAQKKDQPSAEEPAPAPAE
ncbi:MAG: hypothetical protein II964_06505, partial [Synergistaceae bacterium]|nr:hypothetical protein [Synergistaceae bacterium]